jgi:hypothetical protein
MDFNYTYIPFKLGRASTSGTPNDQIANAIKNIAQVSSKLRTTNKLEDVNAAIGDLQRARAVLNNLAIKYKKKN